METSSAALAALPASRRVHPHRANTHSSSDLGLISGRVGLEPGGRFWTPESGVEADLQFPKADSRECNESERVWKTQARPPHRWHQGLNREISFPLTPTRTVHITSHSCLYFESTGYFYSVLNLSDSDCRYLFLHHVKMWRDHWIAVLTAPPSPLLLPDQVSVERRCTVVNNIWKNAPLTADIH